MNFNLNSNPQMQEFLYEFLGLKPLTERNKKGNLSCDEATITQYAEKYNIEFCNLLLNYRKLAKAQGTYIADLKRNTFDDGMVHHELWLNVAETYRSCIAKGTMIDIVRDVSKYPNGIPIEQVKVGDYAYCYDDQLKPQIKKVIWSGKTGHKKVIRIHWQAGRGRKGYLDCTPEHKIRTVSGEYIQAKDLLKNDLRSKNQSKHIPKSSVLALSRSNDELYFTRILTKHNHGIKEHRFIYEQLIGQLKKGEIIHHKDDNHLNHLTFNLEKTTLSKHGKIHNRLVDPIVRLKNKIAVKKGWKTGKYINSIRYGKDNPKHLGLSKEDCISELIRINGNVSHSKYDFNTFKKYLKKHSFNKKDIKDIKQGIIPNNHIITKIEWINKTIDVYDIEVKDCHNFIANEICVHNSSSDPNLQNQPKHGDILPGLPWKTIRKVFVRLNKDYLLGEVDYDGAEVKVSGMLGDDPQLIEDLNNDMDMHSHWAIRLFGLKGYSYDQVKEKFGENERFLAKNNFTFATLFGAQFTSVAAEMRKSDFYSKYVQTHYNQRKAKFEDFNSYYITFSENHIKECQNDFWTRYKIHKMWQKSLIDFYYKHGYVENPFGFRRRYPLSPNEIINYPIQSTSFLLLLDSLIKIEEELVNNNWKSHQINQIHDSGKAYIYKPEIGDYIDMVNDKMVNKPELAWTSKVRMSTDWEFGHNWLEMKRVKEANASSQELIGIPRYYKQKE